MRKRENNLDALLPKELLYGVVCDLRDLAVDSEVLDLCAPLACSSEAPPTHAGRGGTMRPPTYMVQYEEISAQPGGQVVVNASLLSTQKVRHGVVSCLGVRTGCGR
jgi:hypothetical protein